MLVTNRALQNVLGTSYCCPQYTLHTTSHAQSLEMTDLHNTAEIGTEKVAMPLRIPGETVCLSFQVSSFFRQYLCKLTQPQITHTETTFVPLWTEGKTLQLPMPVSWDRVADLFVVSPIGYFTYREVGKQVQKVWKEAKQNTIIQTSFYTTQTRTNPKDH